jgi:hypothetical protein
MTEDDRIARLPIELPDDLRSELLKVYRNMVFQGRMARTVNGILQAVKDGRRDWYSVLHQHNKYTDNGLFPRAYWRTLAIGVPDVLVVAHTMNVFPDIIPDADELEVFNEMRSFFEFKLSLAGASENLPLDVRIATVLQEATNKQAESAMEFSFSYRRKLQ